MGRPRFPPGLQNCLNPCPSCSFLKKLIDLVLVLVVCQINRPLLFFGKLHFAVPVCQFFSVNPGLLPAVHVGDDDSTVMSVEQGKGEAVIAPAIGKWAVPYKAHSLNGKA